MTDTLVGLWESKTSTTSEINEVVNR